MQHSFNKLELLLSTKGFFPKTIFTIDGYCVYIEIFNVYNADTFLLYISSQFNIKPDKGYIYKISYMDIENSDDMLAKYTNESSNDVVKENYKEIILDNKYDTDNIEETLNENYSKEIQIKNINNDDKSIIRDISRQLNRFKQLTQTIKYKISILYKNYLCTTKKDDSIESYYISNFPLDKKGRKLYITIDLKTFYEKNDTIIEDIKIVKNSMYNTLNNNQIKHTQLLNTMLTNKDKLIQYSNMICKKKEYYENYIKELENMLEKLNESERQLNVDKKNMYNKNIAKGGIQSDIENSHIIFKIDEKIENLIELRRELTDDILNTRYEQEKTILEIDKILYDNSVMLNEIIKNFNSISSIIE
jgi:hypothetical protein